MDLAPLLVFTGALFVAAVIPGPGIAAVVGRVLARGREGAIAFCLGMAIGDVVWLKPTGGSSTLNFGIHKCDATKEKPDA